MKSHYARMHLTAVGERRPNMAKIVKDDTECWGTCYLMLRSYARSVALDSSGDGRSARRHRRAGSFHSRPQDRRADAVIAHGGRSPASRNGIILPTLPLLGAMLPTITSISDQPSKRLRNDYFSF